MSKISDINLDKIVSELRKIARISTNEEEFKINAERVLYDNVVSILGLDMGRYEYSLVSGARMDALYGHVIIEYKAPGILSTSSGFAKAKEQIINYIMTEAGVKERLKYFFGIILSDKVAFIKYDTKTDEWAVRGPYEVNREVALKIVEALRGLRRKRLSAEELLKDFGPKSDIALKAINTFYNKLVNSKNQKTQLLFEDWTRIFSQITGYREDDLRGLDEYYDAKEKDYTKFLFSIHTYYALLMKLIAAELAYLYGAGRYLKSYVAELEDKYMKGINEFKNSLKDLEEGGVFSRLLKIKNFIEGGYFSWYLEEFDKDIMDVIAEMARKLSDYEPATPVLEPEQTKDMLKIIYQELVPKPIRHNLGEYYTPDWLAQLLLDRVNFTKEHFNKIAKELDDSTAPLQLRVLDPACGSGTFIIEAIKRLRAYTEEHYLTDMLPDYLLKNVVGIDLNPLAVLAARTNYLLNIGDLLSYTNEVELPIYLADSITIEKSGGLYGGVVYKIKTSAGEFGIPATIIDEKRNLGEILNIVEECVSLRYAPTEFEKRIKNTYINISDSEIETIKNHLYEPLLKLEKEGKNHVWVTILRNAFAPLFIGKFDYVVGNPPWVLWDNLPENYRKSLEKILKNYGLWKPGERWGGSKVDISYIFVYVCSDKYLEDDGSFAFLITQSAFKTKGSGELFRRLKLGNREHLKVIEAHDLVEIQPFEGANNRTAAIILKKGEKTEYPVNYIVWKKIYDIDQKDSLDSALNKLRKIDMAAIPSDPSNELSPWITVPSDTVNVVKKVYGKNSYSAYEGINSGGANGVYWVKILDALSKTKKKIGFPNNRLKSVLGVNDEIEVKEIVVENVTEGMKKKIRKVKTVIEDFFVYPLLKSKNIKKWKIEGYSYALQMHDPIKKIGYDESWVKVNFPKTYAYLKGFEKELKNRKSKVVRQLMNRGPFYSMYAVGEYTYSPYKVVWNRMGNKLNACVIDSVEDKFLGRKIILPSEVISFIPTDNEDEAHYICAIMNSSVTDMVLRSIAGGTKSFGTPKIIEDTIKIPKFDGTNEIHKKLAELSKEAHKHAKNGEDVSDIEEEIDKWVAKLYGITAEDMRSIHKTIAIQEGEIPEEEEFVYEEEKEMKPSVTFMNTVLEPGIYAEIEVILTNPSRIPLNLIIDFLGKKYSFKTTDMEKTFKIDVSALDKGEYSLNYKITGWKEEIKGSTTIQVKPTRKHRKSRLAKKFDELIGD